MVVVILLLGIDGSELLTGLGASCCLVTRGRGSLIRRKAEQLGQTLRAKELEGCIADNSFQAYLVNSEVWNTASESQGEIGGSDEGKLLIEP